MKKAILLITILTASSFIYAYYIGAKSENTWENNWKAPWRGNDVCTYWYSTMNNYSGIDQISHTTLRSPALSRYETDGDQNTTYGLDGFDIFLHCGHSGHYLKGVVHNAQWAMWEDGTGTGTRALSSKMRLGDEARQLKLFSTYGCAQMYNGDNHRVQRWSPVFGGGLKYATGFHGLAWLFGADHAKNRQLGIDYANYLNTTNRTKKIKDAWWDTVKEHPDNAPAVMATGYEPDEASFRRDNATMGNILSYIVRRDGMVRYYATTTWR